MRQKEQKKQKVQQKQGKTQTKHEKMQQNEQQTKKSKKKKENNTQLAAIGYFFTVLFLLMAGYLAYFTVLERESVVNNEYNKRLEALEEKNIRGNILASDGTILARTVVYADGTMQRQYPYGNKFAHVLGISTNGKSGIEKMANYYLLTSNDNPLRKLTNVFQGKKDTGDSVITTLNVTLQEAAYKALGENDGAVVVMEPATGRILAMVSKPDFDPNMIDYTWNSIVESEESVLFNRATQGLYPPGSTFKTITLLEYLRENNNLDQYWYDCDGSIYSGGLVLNCINGKDHGGNNAKDSYAKSCNCAFADMGLSIDKVAFAHTAESLFFNNELPVDFEYSKSSFTMNESSDDAMVMQTSIGQGETLISPLHNCMITAAVANKGILMKPYAIEGIQNIEGVSIKTFMGQVYGSLMTEDEAAVITEYMRAVVADGTATSFAQAPYTVAGKTGSAQYDDSSYHHSWFTGFAPVENPQIAICVLLEGGYSGVSNAHQVARQIMDAYFVK